MVYSSSSSTQKLPKCFGLAQVRASVSPLKSNLCNEAITRIFETMISHLPSSITINGSTVEGVNQLTKNLFHCFQKTIVLHWTVKLVRLNERRSWSGMLLDWTREQLSGRLGDSTKKVIICLQFAAVKACGWLLFTYLAWLHRWQLQLLVAPLAVELPIKGMLLLHSSWAIRLHQFIC